jgi:hypothetical protein
LSPLCFSFCLSFNLVWGSLELLFGKSQELCQGSLLELDNMRG